DQLVGQGVRERRIRRVVADEAEREHGNGRPSELLELFTPAQKKDLIDKVTAAMIEVEGEAMRPVTWVRINEFEGGDRAIGGKALRAADVHALAKGKAA